MFSLSFIVTANQCLIPNQCCNEPLSFFPFSHSLSLSLSLFLFLPLSLSLLFPLSGGLPAMSPRLLLRCCGALSAFRTMLGRFLLSGGCRSPWPSFERQAGRTMPKRWSDPSRFRHLYLIFPKNGREKVIKVNKTKQHGDNVNRLLLFRQETAANSLTLHAIVWKSKDNENCEAQN